MFWWTHGCQLLSQFINFKCVWWPETDYYSGGKLQTHKWHHWHSLLGHNWQYLWFGKTFMLYFVPVHNRFYPSKWRMDRSPHKAMFRNDSVPQWRYCGIKCHKRNVSTCFSVDLPMSGVVWNEQLMKFAIKLGWLSVWVRVAWWHGVRVVWCQGGVVAGWRGVRVAWCQGGKVSGWHGVRVAWCQGGMVSGWRGVRVVWCQGGMMSGWHGVRVAWWHGVRVARCQGGVVSGWYGVRVVWCQGGVVSGWYGVRVVWCQGGVVSGWYGVRVAWCQGGMVSGWM